jgi:hypothetical protein
MPPRIRPTRNQGQSPNQGQPANQGTQSSNQVQPSTQGEPSQGRPSTISYERKSLDSTKIKEIKEK